MFCELLSKIDSSWKQKQLMWTQHFNDFASLMVLKKYFSLLVVVERKEMSYSRSVILESDEILTK